MSESLKKQLHQYFDKKNEIERKVSDLVKSPILTSRIMGILEDSLIQGKAPIEKVPKKFELEIKGMRKELKKFYPFKRVVVY